jgi:hypothetical protein
VGGVARISQEVALAVSAQLQHAAQEKPEHKQEEEHECNLTTDSVFKRMVYGEAQQQVSTHSAEENSAVENSAVENEVDEVVGVGVGRSVCVPAVPEVTSRGCGRVVRVDSWDELVGQRMVGQRENSASAGEAAGAAGADTTGGMVGTGKVVRVDSWGELIGRRAGAQVTIPSGGELTTATAAMTSVPAPTVAPAPAQATARVPTPAAAPPPLPLHPPSSSSALAPPPPPLPQPPVGPEYGEELRLLAEMGFCNTTQLDALLHTHLGAVPRVVQALLDESAVQAGAIEI